MEQFRDFESTLEEWRNVYLDDPHAGLVIANQAVDRAKLLGRLVLARALAVRGSALKTTGQFEGAEQAFREALDTLPPQSREERGDILRRLAYLRAEQCQFDEAIAAVDEAIQLLSDSPQQEGTAVLAKGFILGEMRRHGEAIPFFLNALCTLECQIASSIALHNLIVAISLDDRLQRSVMEEVLRTLDAARKGLYSRGQIFRLKLRWTEALVELRYGLNNKAKTTLTSIRRELRRLDRPPTEIAMITIDLAQAHIDLDDVDRACHFLKKAHAALQKVEGVHPDAPDAVMACIDQLAERAFDVRLFSQLRRLVLLPEQKTSQYAGD